MLVYQVQELLEEVRELRGMVEPSSARSKTCAVVSATSIWTLTSACSKQAEPDQSRFVLKSSAASGHSATLSLTSRPPTPGHRQPMCRKFGHRSTPVPKSPPCRPRLLVDRAIWVLPAKMNRLCMTVAFRALRETRYADAAEGFSKFLDQYPDSTYAPNAQYWLGETYYVTRDFETALHFFQQLLDRYPGSNKQGDALLKIGFSHFELREWNQARAALEQVRSQHPDTTLARLAESRLRDMRLAGHY
jgi:tol-pal system protein YbgF